MCLLGLASKFWGIPIVRYLAIALKFKVNIPQIPVLELINLYVIASGWIREWSSGHAPNRHRMAGPEISTPPRHGILSQASKPGPCRLDNQGHTLISSW